MPRKRIHLSDAERASVSRKLRQDLDGLNALKVKQFSLTREDVFMLDDLKNAWECSGSQVISRLLRGSESVYARRLRGES
ncbi:MAG: hypothetical protein ACYCYP_01940 [Leptospirales bacterium]